MTVAITEESNQGPPLALLHHRRRGRMPRACKLGYEGIVSKRLGSPVCLRPVAALRQEQESGGTSGEARSRGRVEQKAMTVGSVYEGADMDDPQELLKSFHFARSTILRTSALESTLSMILK